MAPSLVFRGYCRLYQWILRLVSPFLPWREPELEEGPGSVLRLVPIMHGLGLKRILVVTDRGILDLGLAKPLLDAMGSQGITPILYSETHPNPTIKDIEDGAALYLQEGCEAILAFGGGSPMDCGKGIGARIARPRKTLAQMKGILGVGRRLPPLFAVPTTAGTGSEVTLAAVVTNPLTHEKYAISDTPLIPRYAALDPELTLGLPKDITATTGMDALTHAIEAFIGRSNTPQTAQDAIDAAGLVLTYLPRAYAQGDDIDARQKMLKAAYLAGRAFTRAYIGNVHALAHTLGGFYGVPHGLANAVLLPLVLDYYQDVVHRPLAEMARRLGVSNSLEDRQAAEEFIGHIRSLNQSMGIPPSLLLVHEEDLATMARRAFAEANPLYPVPKIFSRGDFEILLRRVGEL